MMSVQANPKTHPGGVHGAFCRDKYHSEVTPGPVVIPPKAKAAKFKIPNKTSLLSI